MIPITAEISIDDRDIEERLVRASGPGGQNVNNV
jgi:ribosome-associated protein